MAVANAAELVDALRQHQLLDATQLRALDEERLGDEADPSVLLDVLERRGWLSALQRDYLLQGRAAELAIGPYLLLDRIGKGGMGEVFKARQRRLGRVVAIKVVRCEHVNRPGYVQRFRREALAAARLQHPNVVTIFDADEADGVFFIAMEYVEGIDLARLIKQDGPLPIRDACDYARQAALGLEHAHEMNLIHRDIKPSNLIVTQLGAGSAARGLVKILDFGLARFVSETADSDTLTPPDLWLGTPDYIAPEQARNSKDVDIRADIFSLGCTLYFLLTARPAFAGNNRMEKLVARLQGDATPASTFRPQVPRALDAVLARMLALAPEDRYRLPAEAAKALEPFCGDAIPPGVSAIPVIGSPVTSESATTSGAHGPGERTQRFERNRNDSGATPPLTASGVVPRPKRRIGPGAAVVLGGAVVFVIAALAASVFFFQGDAPGRRGEENSFVNSVGMKLVRIPPGAFLMGAPADEPECGEDEAPQHRVEIHKSFHLGIFEVTQAEFQAIMGFNPSRFGPQGAGAALVKNVVLRDRLPVESVTWDDADEFCRRLTAKEKHEGRAYRLPTEAEWEYACRAGTSEPFHLGRQLSAADANFDGRRPYGGAPPGGARAFTLPVGGFLPNAFGLFDVHGNVWEWCQDRYVPYHEKLRPGGPEKGSGRVMRGGAWQFSGADCRSAKRSLRDQDSRSPYVGFRVACEP